MRLVEQARLHLHTDRSTKVYEVDLCSVGPDRWVVEFRYGPLGEVLREGSRTPTPVPEEEARRVFARLVASKRAKGYVDADADPVPTVVPEAGASLDRDDVLRRYLDDPADAWTDLDGIIVRIGELRVRGCTEGLVARLPGAPPRTVYNIVRALLRCGDESALPSLHLLWESDRAPHIRNLAATAICELAPPEARDRFVAEQRERVPPVVVSALSRGDTVRLLAELRDQPRLLERLYLVHRPDERPALLDLLRSLSVQPPLWQAVRGVYRAAEARGDGVVYGILVRRIHETPPGTWGGDGFRVPTRTHFLRRSWRVLHRLAEAGAHADYTSLAAGVLLAGAGGRSAAWAYHHILHRNDPAWHHSHRRLAWWTTWDELATGRTEAAPEAWDAHPERLVDLLVGSDQEAVHRFAATALADNRGAWPGVELEALADMLAAPFEVTGQLCVAIARARFDPSDPDLGLLSVLVQAVHEPARVVGHRWIRDDPGPILASVGMVTQLVLSPWADTRALSLEVLSGGAVPAANRSAIVEAVLAWAVSPSGSEEGSLPILRDAAVVLQAAFPRELRQVPLDRVSTLITNPAEGVAELGARILLGHEVEPSDLPDQILVDLLASEFEAVRSVGLRLYNGLSVEVLLDRFRVLCALLTHALADVRHGARPIVAKLLEADPAIGDQLVAALLPGLVVEGPEGMHDFVVGLCRDELAPACATLGNEAILSLVGATETVVQALGGDLLAAHVDPSSLTLAQLITMADSDIVNVRRASHQLLDDRVDDVRDQPDMLLDLLDAEWEDTRSFARGFLDDRVGVEGLGAEFAIAVCDSVRPDVQAYGRRTITRMFDSEEGPTYLLKLAEHPTQPMQQFVSAWLDTHAAGEPARVQALAPFFLGVMTQPNQGAVAKARVLAFLEGEAERSETGARVAAQVAVPLSASEALTHRAWAIRVLARIRRRWPDVPTPLVVHDPEVRDAV